MFVGFGEVKVANKLGHRRLLTTQFLGDLGNLNLLIRFFRFIKIKDVGLPVGIVMNRLFYRLGFFSF